MVPRDEPRVLPAPRLARPCTGPPQRGRVLVVAPHPDDEAIGPGATLAAHVRLGDPVHALFVTSGVHGDADSVHDPQAYAELRQDEARAAAAVLGLGSTEFFGLPDSMVVTQADLQAVAARMVALLERLQPEVIYAPHRGESHSDHHFCSLALERAVQQAGCPARVLGYEVWSPLQADLVVDVAETFQTKLEAIRCYRSQTGQNDIARAVEGLNRYRSVLLPPGGRWAEAFEERR